MKIELNLNLSGSDLLNPEIMANARELLLLARERSESPTRSVETQLERQAKVRAARESFCAAHGLQWRYVPPCVKGGKEWALRARIEGERGKIEWDLLDVRANTLLDYGYDLIAVREAGGEQSYFANGARPAHVVSTPKNFRKPKT